MYNLILWIKMSLQMYDNVPSSPNWPGSEGLNLVCSTTISKYRTKRVWTCKRRDKSMFIVLSKRAKNIHSRRSIIMLLFLHKKIKGHATFYKNAWKEVVKNGAFLSCRHSAREVKTQCLHFRTHAEYSLLFWKIPEEISRRSILFHNQRKYLLYQTYAHATF